MTGEATRVFAHLAHDKDAEAWRRRHADGTLVGRNDETPYGYGRADQMGCRVAFSRPGREGPLAKAARYAARLALGYDREHARRQLPALRGCDVIWCHTESQTLAVADVLGPRRPGRPAVVGQVVWLLDRWPSLAPARRALYRRLASRLDVLTTLSPENAARARELFPGTRVEFVPFGIPSEGAAAPRAPSGGPVRAIAVGNDRHRDWPTLAAVFHATPGASLRIVSGTAPAYLARGTGDVSVRPATTQAELEAAYGGADVAVVPLSPNLHASGITAVQEAILAGLPVVATDVGGLRAYFADDEVSYVPPGDPAALAAAVEAIRADPAAAAAATLRAQRAIAGRRLDAEGYVRRHVDLTREILR